MGDGFGVFLGLDVGKDAHHAVGLGPAGKRLHDGPLPNSGSKPRALFDKLAAQGPPLVVVDQPATIGALPVAVARAAGHRVAYLPGLAMRRIADLHPGRAKTDARDAFVIADAPRMGEKPAPRSWPPWTNRPSSSQAPPRPTPSCPARPTA